jgi:hypothetical protein
VTEDFSFVIDVPVRTEWSNVSLLVTSVQNCFNAMFANIEGSQTIATVTGELLENAIKYGAWRDGHNIFRLKVGGGDHHARIVVENPIKDGAEDLLGTLAWLRNFERPEEAYVARLLEIAQSPPHSNMSKLGLVRIVYEAGGKLEAVVDGTVVRVTASLEL